MVYATLEQLNDRLYQIDDQMFKLETGQIPGTLADRERLESEADWIMTALAKGISEGGTTDFQTAWETRAKVRKLRLLAAAVERSAQLKPPTPEDDERFVAIINNPNQEEMATLFSQELAHIFVTLPPAVPTPARTNFFRRLFSKPSSSTKG